MIRTKRRMGVLLFLAVLVCGIFVSGKWMLHTLYPLHYSEEIRQYAAEYELDPYLVAAIIKNESKFNTEAVSRKDARGLMQIAPITGEWASEMLAIEDYQEARLHEPDLNIRIGCWYLSVLRSQFGVTLQPVLAAYNAGNGNVSKWLENPEYSQDGKTLTVIPFPETSAYVVKVERDYQLYTMIYEEGIFSVIRYVVENGVAFILSNES